MTETKPQDSTLESFQNPTRGYAKRPAREARDSLPNTTCAKCGSNLVYRTLNYIYAKNFPFNCVNCTLIREIDVIHG